MTASDNKVTLLTGIRMDMAKYLKAGLLAGLLSVVLNNIIYLIVIAIGGHDWAFVVVLSIIIASFLPGMLASIGYLILSHITKRAWLIMTIVVLAFVLISVLPHLGIGPAPSPALAALPEGFDLVTIPLHLVFGLSAIFVMPWLVARENA